MGSNPFDAVPGYMPMLEYKWKGSTETRPPSGCTVIAFKENLRKLPGTLSERGLAKRVRGVTRWTKKPAKRQKAKQKPKNKK